MGIIKQGINITRTMKNVSRLREIVSVLAQNGLDEFIVKSGMHKIIPHFVLPRIRVDRTLKEAQEGKDAPWPEVIGRRLRWSFEELGPSFIKIGQLLGTREDLFPPEFISQMHYLRSQVQGIPFDRALGAIDQSLGRDHRQVFRSIDAQPIGSASIGLAYRAQLQNGDHVVIKLRRPGIEKIIPVDLSMMEFIVERLERASVEIKYLGLSRVIKEFGSCLHNELDFRLEALNCQRIRHILAKRDERSSVLYS